MLLKGEAYLFASLTYMKTNRGRALDLYRNGIRILDRVIQFADSDPKLDKLPDYRYQLVLLRGRYGKQVHPPWRVEMFRLLEDAGLTQNLDYRILRPFAGKLPPLYRRPFACPDEIPPTISEIMLKSPSPQIPKHIYDEMMMIVGDGPAGNLDTLGKKLDSSLFHYQ